MKIWSRKKLQLKPRSRNNPGSMKARDVSLDGKNLPYPDLHTCTTSKIFERVICLWGRLDEITAKTIQGKLHIMRKQELSFLISTRHYDLFCLTLKYFVNTKWIRICQRHHRGDKGYERKNYRSSRNTTYFELGNTLNKRFCFLNK